MINYDEMTIEELEALNQTLMQQKATLRDNQRKVAEALNAKRQEAALDADVKRLQEKYGDKVQIVAPDGIQSKERFES